MFVIYLIHLTDTECNDLKEVISNLDAYSIVCILKTQNYLNINCKLTVHTIYYCKE